MTIGRAKWATVLGASWLLATGGCTRGNGAFEGGTDPESSDGTTSDPEPTDTTASTGVGTSVASTGGTTVDVPDGTTAEAETSPPQTEGSTGAPACTLHDEAPIDINVLEGGKIEILPPAGCGEPIFRTNGPLIVVEGTLVHEQCDCDCLVPGDETVLDFNGTLELPAMPECGGLVMWPRMTDQGCVWDGFAVLDADTPQLPAYLGANSRGLPNAPFGGVDVHLVPDGEPCANPPMECTPPTGRHGLEFFSEMPVFVGMPMVVEIGFVVGLPYLVTNRMSSIDEQCDEQVSWTALMDG